MEDADVLKLVLNDFSTSMYSVDEEKKNT